MHFHMNRWPRIFICSVAIIQGCATTNNDASSSLNETKINQTSNVSIPETATSPEANFAQGPVILNWDQYLVYNPSSLQGTVDNSLAATVEQQPAAPVGNQEPKQEIAPKSANNDISGEVPSTAIVRVPGKTATSQETKAVDYLANQENLGDKPNKTDMEIGSRPPDVRSMPVGLEASPDMVDEQGTYQVSIPGLNARSGPSMQASVVRTLNKGQIIQGTSREGIWIHTAENDYVSINFLTKVTPR